MRWPLRFYVAAGFALAPCLAFGQNINPNQNSLVLGAPSGGNQGYGTINAEAVLVNGVPVGGGVTVPTTTLAKTTAPGTISQVTAIDAIPIGQVTPAAIGATSLSATGTTTTAGINDSAGINTTSTSGFLIGGSSVLRAFGQSLTAGIGAGAALPLSDIESTVAGYGALAVWSTTTGENTIFGWNNAHALIGGTGGNSLFGDGNLIFDVAAFSDTISGADAGRNVMGTSFDTASGRRALAYGSPTFSSAFGAVSMEGNSGSVLITGTPTTGDVLNVILTQGTNALTASISGTTLTVTVAASNAIGIGQGISGGGITPTPVILSQLTGTAGGAGTYQLSASQGTVGSESMTAQGFPVVGGLPITFQYTVPSGSPSNSTMAAGIAAVINANTPGGNIGASSFQNGVIVIFPGTSTTGEAITVTTSVTGSGTETLTPGGGANCLNCTASGYQSLVGGVMTNALDITTYGYNSATQIINAQHALILGDNAASVTFAIGSYAIIGGSNSDTFSAGSSDLVVWGPLASGGSDDTNGGYLAGSSTAADGLFTAAWGWKACLHVSTGINNSCFGGGSGDGISSGTKNTFAGFDAGTGTSTPLTGSTNSGFGAFSLLNIQGTSNSNSALGASAGQACTTCQVNDFIGAGVGQTGTATVVGDILIGVNSTTTTAANDTLLIGGRVGVALTCNTMNLANGVFCAMPGVSLTLGVASTVAGNLTLEGSTSGAAVLTGGTTGIPTSAAFQLGTTGTAITLNGDLALQKTANSATAPGAGFLKLESLAGTTGGTCKVVAYAGTSTTPIVLIDNVGSGC